MQGWYNQNQDIITQMLFTFEFHRKKIQLHPQQHFRWPVELGNSHEQTPHSQEPKSSCSKSTICNALRSISEIHAVIAIYRSNKYQDIIQKIIFSNK